jgi:hypothetical protein
LPEIGSILALARRRATGGGSANAPDFYAMTGGLSNRIANSVSTFGLPMPGA